VIERTVKYTLIFFCAAALLIIALTAAGSRTIGTELCVSPEPTPTPYVVPGTEWKGYTVKAKPGYQFVKQEVGVSVVKLRTNAYMGSYTCPCKSTDPNRKCELIFSPNYIICKGGSCGGSSSCIFVGSTPALRR
jgi:hypothetical protein